MIRLRPLRPREQRNLRHWAMELVVVVVGVMIALWASEWAADQRDRAEIAASERQMRDELRDNHARWLAHRIMEHCQVAFIRDLRAKLIASDAHWPGYESPYLWTLLDGKDMELGIISVTTYELTTDAFERAKLSGLLEKMDADTRAQLINLYGLVNYKRDAMQTMRAARDELSPLIYPLTLSPDVKAAAFKSLVKFSNALVRRSSDGQFTAGLETMGIGETAASRAFLEAAVREIGPGTQYDSCYVEPTDQLKPEKSQ